MKSIRADSPKQRIALLVAAVLLLGGAIAFFCGEWGPGVGEAGVASKLVSACGMALFASSLLLLSIIFTKSYIGQFSRKTPESKRSLLKELGHQTLIACLNVLVYGGLFIVVMGGISALDAGSIATTLVVIVIWGGCIASFILYRRYRKAHRTRYDLFSSVAITVFFFLFGGFLLVGTALNATDATQDLEQGPIHADVFLVDAKIDYPNWRYARFVQTDHVLTFFTANEEKVVLEVPENDIASAKVINDEGNFVHLTYYPRTQVFCSATRWGEGQQAMGKDLLDKLREEYDFTL